MDDLNSTYLFLFCILEPHTGYHITKEEVFVMENLLQRHDVLDVLFRYRNRALKFKSVYSKTYVKL